MEEDTKKEPEKPEEKGWAEKAKKLIDKADDFIDENVDKVKKSKAFGKVKETVDKAEDEAKEKLSKAKEFGKKVAAKTADKLDDLAEDIRNKTKDDKKPEDLNADPQP
jgi:gas vesicle protein